MITCKYCKFWVTKYGIWGNCDNPVFSNCVSSTREDGRRGISCLHSFGCILGESKKTEDILKKLLDSKKYYETNLKINLKNLQDEISDLEKKLNGGWITI